MNQFITFKGTMLEYPEDAWDKIFEINVKVSFLLFKDCVPHMKVKDYQMLTLG